MHLAPGVAVLLLACSPALALNNGLALTPPCGLNSYMSGKSGAAFLSSIADYFVAQGLDKQCFTFVNSDEGWEMHDRNATTHELMPDLNQYPGGIEPLVASLAAKGVGIKLGLYGAASGVTCGGISGQLGYENIDVATLKRWGVRYWKSDNCASYAMDSSVRFAATRDAMLRQQAPIVLSIEPFSISPDVRQSSKVANLWRIAKDICGSWGCTINRASISDKWAPLAGPGGWNDPDASTADETVPAQTPQLNPLPPPRYCPQTPKQMMNVGDHMTPGENRALFGLWAIMKAPMLLSADLPNLPANIQAIINSPEVIATNQDPLGVQARKLMLDGAVMPWLVGFESCSDAVGGGLAGMRNRGWGPVSDTRVWTSSAHANVAGAVLLANNATGRCLQPGRAQGLDTVVLLPCNASDPSQAWVYGTGGAQTVSALVHSATGLALAVGNSTLFSSQHGDDQAPVPDAAYGTVALTLDTFLPTEPCGDRDCEGYHPQQLFYGPDFVDSFIAQSTYVGSINHCDDGDCYELSHREPTYAHHCLAHVLSVRNMPSDSGTLEVWGGPLTGGAFVLGLLNTGGAAAQIAAPFSALGVAGVGDGSQFCVRALWAPAANVGSFTGSFAATIQSHDLGVYKLTPGAC